MPIAVPAFFAPVPAWMRTPAPAPWPVGAGPLPGLATVMPATVTTPGAIAHRAWQDRSRPAGLAAPEPVRAALQRFLLAPWKPAVHPSVLAESQRSMIAPDRPWAADVP